MRHYDPEVAPDSAEWLALEEQERIDLVEDYHRTARIDLPNVTVHAVVHSAVENQLAEGLEPVVRAMARLMNEGLSRHDALHAIGCIVTDHLRRALNLKDKDYPKTAQASYNAAVDRLTVEEWHRLYGG